MESGLPSKTFSGVRFALVGFNPVDGNTLRSKLLSGGGVDVGQHSQICTHLIVDKLVYDDPICVAARSSGKVVVTGSWVDHSFDIGMLIDANSVLYRPLRDLNGIPGAKNLVVCLTGYQRQDREDIMTMVDLMGGQFSKPLVANRVTHLICYKFEGEKYELAKRMKRIKLVNHRWLEDCLKSWKLLPEVNYEISGYELEMMEASARDSEDELEDASMKRANNSPLGLRVGAVASVERSKSGGKDIPVVKTEPGPQEGSSLCNTFKDNWLTPKKMEIPLEPVASADAAAAKQHSYHRASTNMDTSNYVSPIPVNKTSEQGMDRMETNDSTSINMSIRRHSSLATYSRKTLQKSPETSILGNETSGKNGSLRMDDRGLNSTAFNISASKSGSSAGRTTLFQDLDNTDMLNGMESPPLLPQERFANGSVSSKGSQKLHHISKASIPPVASLLLQELKPDLPKENCGPVPSINNPTESREVEHKSPASVLNTKLLSSNVVPLEDALATAENINSKCARDEIPEKSSTDPMMGNILIQEPRSGSPKQNLSDHAEGREVEHKLEAENITLKDALDELPERSVTEPAVGRSSTSTDPGLVGMRDKLETELPKKKSVLKKSLGTRNKKKSPINQKGSIYLSEPTPKDERIDSLNKGKVSEPVADNGNQKEKSSPVLNAKNVPEMAEHVDSETEVLKGIDSADNRSYPPEEKDHLVDDLLVNQDKLQAENLEEADAEVAIRTLEPELNDDSTEDPSDGALQIEVDKNESKRTTRVPTIAKNSFQNRKKESSSTAKARKSSAKKTKQSSKEHDAKANDTVMKDIEDLSVKEKENTALENKSTKVCSGGDESPVTEEAETKDQSGAAVQLGVDENKGEHIKEVNVGTNSLKSGKKRSSPTVESGKPSVKKTKKSKKEGEAKANDTLVKDIRINSAEVKDNEAVDKKSGGVSSDEAKSPVSGKTSARREAADKSPNNAAKQLEAAKNKRKRGMETTIERSSPQSGKKGSSSTVEVVKSSVKKPKKPRKECVAKAVDSVTGDNNSAEEKENTAVNNKSGREKSPVSEKPLARKVSAKSAKTGAKADKESKQLTTKSVATRKALHDREQEPKYFIVSGPRLQRKEYQQIIKSLKGKCCRDSHQWSYQATHFIATEIRRTEKFFAAAASGSWILKTDYVADSKEAGKLLPEEPYEWHGTGLSSDGSISLESPRKWRLVREQTGHGALYGMRIVVYGDCTIPSLDTLKRAVKAGDGTILATAPPYTRFLNQATDFALISPGIPSDDVWIKEFISHEIPCVLSDYLVEYVCKPGYSLDKHVLYNTNSWAQKSFNNLVLISTQRE